MTITFVMRQHYGEVTSYQANTTDITAGMLVALDSSGLLIPATASTTNVIGVAGEDRDVSENPIVPVYQGTLECTLESVASGITAGANIECAAGGCIADSGTAGKVVDFGVAHEAATGAAEWVRCTLNLPAFVT